MNFSLEICDPFHLIVACELGCESAISHTQSLTNPADVSSQAFKGPVVWARVSRDPSTKQLVLRLNCDFKPSGSQIFLMEPHPLDHNERGESVTEFSQSASQARAAEPIDAAEADEFFGQADLVEPTGSMKLADSVKPAAGDAELAAASSSDEAEDAVSVVRVAYQPSTAYTSAFDEFISTEQTYVRRLSLLFDLYYPGLVAAVQGRQLGCCSPDELKRIFGHFQGMKLMHEQLLSDVMHSGRLGKFMIQYGHQLKSYGAYYSMFQQITATVRGWMTDESFRQVFVTLRMQCQDLMEAQLDLRALLLEPVQRPMRYPMLLDKYLAEIGPDHPDSPSTSCARDIVLDVLQELEKSLRDFAAFQERLQLLRSVAFPAGFTYLWEELAHSCLRHSIVRMEDKQRYLLLSKRTLLICSQAARFRQETWVAKRALPVPGELRVLGCEGNLLRLDTPRDPQLHLTFGESDSPENVTGGQDGVRECRDWAMEFRKLGVPFMDYQSDVDIDQMPWERAAGRTGRPVMTPLDKATRCQACGSAYRLLQRRRLSCRVCGGAFCSDCTDYQSRTSWSGDRLLRCCLFCRVAAGATPAELTSERHRSLLARFQLVRDMDADPDTLSGPLVAWLSGRWVAVWCRLEPKSEQLSLFRHRRDFLPILTVEAPRASTDTDGVELLVHDHERRREGCRLRVDEAGGGDGEFLRRLAKRLGNCDSEGRNDCMDGVVGEEDVVVGAISDAKSLSLPSPIFQDELQPPPSMKSLTLPTTLTDRPLTPIDGW